MSIVTAISTSMPTSAGFAVQNEGRPIHIVFRMDDYSAISDINLESHILDLFQEKGIGLTLGVVPLVCSGSGRDPSPQNLIELSRKKIDLIKERIHSGLFDVALHGYSHQSIDKKMTTEFAGLDYGAQIKKLTEGKRFLEESFDISVRNFIPPWNSYDFNTLHALGAAGFDILSAGWTGCADKNSKLSFLPATSGLSNIKDAVFDARTSSDRNPVIVVLFHHYDFKELKDDRGNITLDEFSDLLDWLKLEKNLKFLTIRQATEFIDDLSVDRFLFLERWRRLENFLPRNFHEKKPVLLYREASLFTNTFFKVCLYYSLITLSSAFISFLICFLVFQTAPHFLKITVYGIVFIIIFFNIYYLKDVFNFKGFEFTPKRLKVILGTIGCSSGLLVLNLILY